MKKNILLLSCMLWCTVGWAQVSSSVELTKNKEPEQVVTVRQPDQDEKSLQVYPNPSNGVVHLTLAGFKGKKTELRIMNVIGNIVYREIFSDINGQFTKSIDLSKHASGLYYVKLQTDDFSEIRKVILN